MHDSEHPLYVMYTSGTTGTPKGILHTTGGYLTGTSYTHWAVFDLKDDDVYWCTADVGWVTGHSYMVYGPLANGATQVMYEDAGRPAQGPLVGDHREVRRDHLLHRADRDPDLHEEGRRHPRRHDLSSIRLLGSVGESINPEAYIWYREVHRRGAGSHRRHLVADRDRADHGQPAARGHRRQARLGHEGPAGHLDRRGQRRGGVGRQRQRRLPRDPRALAGDAAHAVGRRPALHRHLLVALGGSLLRRRRRQARRGRRHLAARPGRRRHEHLRPPALHHRDRVGPRVAPQGRRGGRRRGRRRDHRPGGLRVRDPAGVTAGDGGPDIVEELRKHVRRRSARSPSRARS